MVFRAPFTRFARKMVSTLYGALGRRIAKRFASELIATIGCFFIAFSVGDLVCLALGSPMAPV
ncbi:hypothetical protein EDF53_1330 [Curtobacterium sp. PhB78]|nr:hypothetical protein EDF53_1330 [Curtobacterium sp. PhB78]